MNFEEIANGKNVDTKYEHIDFSDADSIKNGIIEVQTEYKNKGIELSAGEALKILKNKGE